VSAAFTVSEIKRAVLAARDCDLDVVEIKVSRQGFSLLTKPKGEPPVAAANDREGDDVEAELAAANQALDAPKSTSTPARR
jgi:hypothetical protein